MKLTAATYFGNLSGVAGADAKCQAEYGSGYKAMVVDGAVRQACASPNCTTGGIAEHIDWVLQPGVTYLQKDGLTPIFTADQNGVYDTTNQSFLHPIDPAPPNPVWTGMDVNWILNTGNNCTNWTSTATNGSVGDATMLINSAGNGPIGSTGTNGCSSLGRNLLCVQQ